MLALTVLGAVVAYLVSKSLTPIYEAKGDVLVIAGPNQATGTAGLNLNATQATTTAATLLTEPPLLQTVINTLHLTMTTDQLAKEVTATPQSNTELVDVLVRDPSPALATQIDNAVMATYVSQVTAQNSGRIDQAGAALQSEISQIQTTINQEQTDLAAAQKANQDTTALRAAISSNSALLTQLTLSYSSFKATQAQNLETVSVAAEASTPTSPASPRPTLNAALGAVAGLVVGLGLAALFEYLDQGLHTADDVTERLGVPCLGVVPRYKASALAGATRRGSRKQLSSEERATNAASEAYRRMRTNILFSTPDADLNSIVLTSVRAGEGKTRTASNLAVALASSEKRVLLIDADMRRPDQHRVFGKGLDNGMSELIMATSADSLPTLNGVHSTNYTNLSLITSGTIPPNPSELLASKRARILIEGLSKRHDVVVIDTPPAGVVTDALSVAADATLTVLVVEAGRTNAAQAAEVIESLRSVGANVAGVVLNKARRRDWSGYYYQYGDYAQRAAGGDKKKRKSSPPTAPARADDQT